MMNSRRMRRRRHVACMGKNMSAYRVLVGKPEGKRPLGKSRRRYTDNINMGLRGMGWGYDLHKSDSG
jgi:hypothetical protein